MYGTNRAPEALASSCFFLRRSARFEITAILENDVLPIALGWHVGGRGFHGGAKMLDEISEKYQFMVTYFRMWKNPFGYVQGLDLSRKAVRKTVWKFFFFAIGIAFAFYSLFAGVIRARAMSDVCSDMQMFSEGSSGRDRIAVYILPFAQAVIVHFLYVVSRRASERKLSEYLPLTALFASVIGISLSIYYLLGAWVLDLFSESDFRVFAQENCESTISSLTDYSVMTRAGRVADTIYLWNNIVMMAINTFWFVAFISWTSKFYCSSWMRAFALIMVSAAVSSFAYDYYEGLMSSLSNFLDASVPHTLRAILRDKLGL
ncbi:hypothetical protein ACIQUS_20515 [Pseudomonas sp. NPDC090755]|uniref:hypothetical protein n=1 Tax=Pseudomonas sp. NPDC090755 TaxID=3364481 RepID=UPI00383B1408